ncbi:restriction endonuclease subunit S [Streptomyces sp. NPDC018947]|uniref:restriction endonuclease subunit S n=1 Tax=Streptomyces sp. NPDC018947 TaxID=3365054 RepID=UPI00378B2C14
MTFPTTKLKWVATSNAGGTPSVAEPSFWSNDDETGLPWVSIGDMSGRDWVTTTGRRVTDAGVSAARLPVGAPGTLLLSMYASLGHTAFLTTRASWNQAILGIDVSPSYDVRFVKYALDAIKPTLTEFARSNTQANLNAEQVGNLALPDPPLGTQRRIADFLDTETARIDHVANLRRQQRDLLASRRWSQFQEVMDTVAGPVIPLRRVIRSVIDGPFGSAFSSADYIDEGAAVIRLGNIGFAEYRPADQAYIPMSLYRQFQYHEVSRGDVLIAGLGDARNHAGRACVAPALGPAIVKGKCFRARLETEAADADFIALLLSSPVGASSIEGRGSTRSMINLEIVKSAMLPIPELRKQRSVVAEHRQSWSRTKAAVDACERQLNLLAERRQALITAAVTGQFDVSTASGRNVTEGVSA